MNDRRQLPLLTVAHLPFRIFCCLFEYRLGKPRYQQTIKQIVYSGFSQKSHQKPEQNKKTTSKIMVRVTRLDPPVILLAHYAAPG
jgi:hypothetical protein